MPNPESVEFKFYETTPPDIMQSTVDTVKSWDEVEDVVCFSGKKLRYWYFAFLKAGVPPQSIVDALTQLDPIEKAAIPAARYFATDNSSTI